MLKLIKKHFPVILFGMLQIFFSAPGQTFLISLFVNDIFKHLGISLSLFAGLYSAATLTAALLLNPAGRLIDRYYVHQVVTVITVCMAAGCWLLAAAQNAVMVFIAFFILRLIGQGVYGLTASTLIIKKFHLNRGRAMGLITLGFPFSEAVYPVVALFLINHLGWQMSYVLFGLSNLLLMLPVQWFLLRKARLEHGHFLPGEELVNPQRMPGEEPHQAHIVKDATLGEALKDVKFYLLLISSCIPPLIVTGLFFHQERLFTENGWPMTLAASGFGFYAFCKAVGSVGIGPFVDKYGALGPFILIILMLAAGTLLPVVISAQWVVYVYFCILGAALGFSSPVMNVVWPRFYGVKHMGSLKGFIATFRNGLTAFGPLPIALAIDAGIKMNQVLAFMSMGTFLIAFMPIIVWRMDKRSTRQRIKNG